MHFVFYLFSLTQECDGRGRRGAIVKVKVNALMYCDIFLRYSHSLMIIVESINSRLPPPSPSKQNVQ